MLNNEERLFCLYWKLHHYILNFPSDSSTYFSFIKQNNCLKYLFPSDILINNIMPDPIIEFDYSDKYSLENNNKIAKIIKGNEKSILMLKQLFQRSFGIYNVNLSISSVLLLIYISYIIYSPKILIL